MVLENNEDNIEEIESEAQDSSMDTTNYEILTYGADYTLSVLYEKIKNGEIVIPKFQRKFVWKLPQASKLIESFLLGLPVPGIFLSRVRETEELLVVDGQQRLKSIEAFRDEKFFDTEESFCLKNIHEKWEGKKYSGLEMAEKRRFNDSIMRATIIQQINPLDDTSVYHIFERLNTGGTTLQNQEIRNCVYTGKFNSFLHELNRETIWRKLYNSQTPSPRMKDEELILRFLALYYEFEDYKKPLNEFLSKFMNRHRNLSDEKQKEMKNLFMKVITFIDRRIGLRAFRPVRNLNMAAYDSIMVTIAKYYENLRDDIDKQINGLFHNEAYQKAIRLGTTDSETIKSRMKITKQYLTNDK